MNRLVLALAMCLTLLAAPSRADSSKLKAVMYVGGCCHDYKKMPGYLAEKIGLVANVAIEVKLMNDAAEMAKEFKDPKFGEGYDVIIYDICFGEKWEDGDYD